MIEFIDVNYFYGKKQALKNLNLKIEKGSFNLFIGHNGSGKSTTVKLILNLIHNKKGKVIRNYQVVLLSESPRRVGTSLGQAQPYRCGRCGSCRC